MADSFGMKTDLEGEKKFKKTRRYKQLVQNYGGLMAENFNFKYEFFRK